MQCLGGAFDSRLKIIVSSSGWTQFENYNRGKKVSSKYGGRLGPWAQDLYMPLLRSKYKLDDQKIPFNFNEVIDLLSPRAFFSNSPLKDKNFSVKGVKTGIAMARKAYQFIDQALNHVPSDHEIE